MLIKVTTKAVGFLFDAQVWLEGQETKLSYDGDKTRTSTDIVDVTDGTLDITFHGVGVPTTEWKLTIDQLEPVAKKLYEREGSIRKTGHSLIKDSVDLS